VGERAEDRRVEGLIQVRDVLVRAVHGEQVLDQVVGPDA
jgi:hypothetical protein